MIWWMVDNLAYVWLFCFALAVCFAVAWWMTGKTKVLIGITVAAGIAVLAGVLSVFIVTDRMQLVQDVHSMRDLINAGKFNEALQHFDEEITADTNAGKHTVKRANLAALAKGNMQAYSIKTVIVKRVQVEELSRPNAQVSFFLGPEDSGERGLCKMGFVLGQDGKWRVRTVSVESMIGGHKMPLILPLGG